MRVKTIVAGAGLCGLLWLCALPPWVAGKPSNGAIRIGSGRLNSAEWISTLAHKKGAGPQSVCVSIALAIERNGTDISEAFECEGVRDDLPFIEFLGGHSKNGARSVYTEIFSPAVRKVVVGLGGDSESTVRLKRPSKSRARELGMAQVGYWVHAFTSPACIKEITAYGRLGEVLSQGKFGC